MLKRATTRLLTLLLAISLLASCAPQRRALRTVLADPVFASRVIDTVVATWPRLALIVRDTLTLPADTIRLPGIPLALLCPPTPVVTETSDRPKASLAPRRGTPPGLPQAKPLAVVPLYSDTLTRDTLGVRLQAWVSNDYLYLRAIRTAPLLRERQVIRPDCPPPRPWSRHWQSWACLIANGLLLLLLFAHYFKTH